MVAKDLKEKISIGRLRDFGTMQAGRLIELKSLLWRAFISIQQLAL